MDRVILHVDMNNFFASVECADRPELWTKPVAVAGDVQARHGIILAKNQVAKGFGVQTGESIAEARSKCPSLVLLPPHMDRYKQISDKARGIYARYTDRVESFGIDECWLDVTGNGRLWGKDYGKVIAEEIRQRIKTELGVTVSVGVSFNKIFAKMGSDYKKPDAVTVITRENFRELLWGLPVGELIFVGRSTAKKLWYMQIRTVGDLARADPALLEGTLGKQGLTAWQFANGMDGSPVLHDGQEYPIKSIGNSTTTPVDMVTRRDAEIVLAQLCQSVATRLRTVDMRCTTVKLALRTTDLAWKPTFGARQWRFTIPFTTANRCAALGCARAIWWRTASGSWACLTWRGRATIAPRWNPWEACWTACVQGTARVPCAEGCSWRVTR